MGICLDFNCFGKCQYIWAITLQSDSFQLYDTEFVTDAKAFLLVR
jgi:hypothetical protein